MLSVLSMMESGHLDGDDEDDHHHDEDDHHHDSHPLSKAELRKSNKPIMEKRRRARINTCLNELKSLILDAMKKDPARHSKLEKADILEMTVKHLQAVQRQQLALAVAHDPAVLTKFRGGFAECAQEVTRYVSRIEGVDGGVRQRLLQHLGQCVSGLSAMTPLSFTAMAGLPLPMTTHLQGGGLPSSPHPGLQQGPGDVNNNQARLLHSLVAARLAAAGDAAGAAFLLQGGLSLLARAAPHAPPSSQPPPSAPSQATPSAPPPPPPPPQPQQVVQPSVVKVNDGASSSGERPARPSAFTAVRRGSSPPRASLEIHSRPQDPLQTGASQAVLTPTVRRLVGVPDARPETVVHAQVAVQPVNLALAEPRDADARAPLDFSFRKRPVGRPMPTHPAHPTPTPLGSGPTTPSHPTVIHPTPKHLTPTMGGPVKQHQHPAHSQTPLSSKRPLEEAEPSPRAPKLLRIERPSQPLQPPRLVMHLTPPGHSSSSCSSSSSSDTSPLRPSPPEPSEPSLPGPSPSRPSPPIHSSSPGTSPPGPATPKEELVSSEDNASPDRPSTSSTQEEKDMWRPW
ncbi:protein hairy-like [Penaeus japonicus]|uniref:protein hairy-like n=1 Tax=Penaeus japonicus TaxID=27405 RepID=UPI001C70D37E|nr:protein hairy-like [Penaeus japonicus]